MSAPSTVPASDMTLNRSLVFPRPARFAALVLCFVLPAGMAQSPAPGHVKPARKANAPKAVAPKPAEFIIPPANAEQIDAAGRVFYGVYECEFKQTIQILASLKYPSYVDVNVRLSKADYLMKPVLSSTGAIRLEDVRGEMLMVQISSKSMLLNVKAGRREADECITPRQRELVEAARVAKAKAAAAAAAAAAASVASAGSAGSAASAASADSAASAAPVAPVASAAPAASRASEASEPAARPASVPAASAVPAMTEAPSAPGR